MMTSLREQWEAAWRQREELRRNDVRAPRLTGPSVEIAHLAGPDGRALCGAFEVMAYLAWPSRDNVERCARCEVARG